MREQRGVTLTSVVIYVMVMTIIVGIITAITAFFYSNTTQMNESATSLGEYNKFNTAFLAEVKKIDNEVYKIENDSQRIIFKSGTMFTFQDGGIYQNRVKICTGVTNCKFSVKEQEEKQIVTVLIEIGQNAEFAKTTDYVLDDTDYQGSNEIQHVHNYKYWRKIDETVHIGICNCGATQEGEHEYGEWIQTTPATCTVAGTQTSTCPECKTTVIRRFPDATGHTYGEWIQTIPATCTVAGTQTSTCSVCNTTETRRFPDATGHTDACYSTECKGSFALASTSTETYYTCSHKHAYVGNGVLVSGTALADDAAYSAMGGCYYTPQTYSCTGRVFIFNCTEFERIGVKSSCCNANCIIGTIFETKCNNPSCNTIHKLDVTADSIWYCSNCSRYIERNDGTASSYYIYEIDQGMCGAPQTKYGPSCNHHTGTINYTRQIETYKCATCGKTTKLYKSAWSNCWICGGEHSIQQSGSTTTAHNAVKPYLICDK